MAEISRPGKTEGCATICQHAQTRAKARSEYADLESNGSNVMTAFHHRLVARSWVRVALFACATLWSGLAIASTAPNTTKGEIAMLPPYCPDTAGFSYTGPGNPATMSPKANYWVAQLGQDFWWVHHYCWATVWLNRGLYKASGSADRRFNLRMTVREIDFTLDKVKPNFVLLPEMLTKRGEVLLLLSESGAAYDSFRRAREIKPDYWPAYTKWAEVLIKSGLKAEAKVLIREGLKYAPESKELLAQFKLLGGSAAELEAIRPAVPNTPTGATSEPAQKTASDDATKP